MKDEEHRAEHDVTPGGDDGEQAEFGAACTRHYEFLVNVARKLVRSDDRARDLVQDTMVRAMRSWSTYTEPPEASTRPWLYRILHNLVVDSWRRKERERVGLEHLETIAVRESTNVTEHTYSGKSVEIRSEVMAAVSRLRPSHRQVVHMEMHGMRYKDIAKSISAPMGTVMSRLHRARHELRVDLASPDIDVGVIRERRPRRASQQPRASNVADTTPQIAPPAPTSLSANDSALRHTILR